jgi:hypothetical protein
MPSMLATPFLQAEQAASHACLVPNRRDHDLDIVDKETLDAGTEQDQADSNTNYRNLLLSIRSSRRAASYMHCRACCILYYLVLCRYS